MGNIVEFILRLKDMMSSNYAQAAASVQRSTQNINRNVNSIPNSARRAGERSAASIAVLERALRRLEYRRSITVDTSQITRANADIRRLRAEIDRLKNLNNPNPLPGDDKKDKGMFASMLGANLVSSGLSRAAEFGKQFAMDSIAAAMDYSKSVKSFEVLTGSADRGRELAGELRQLKQSTIIGAGVYRNAQTMMGFGIGNGEVVKDLKMIGDIAMGDQDRIQSLTLAFSQTRAAGRLMGQDLLQYINAGFNPLAVMSEKWQEFGFKGKVSVGYLRDAMSEGKISAEMVTKAFELATSKGGKYYNMMDAIGQTSAGQLMKLKGNWAAFQIDMGNMLMPLANNFMQAANDALHFLGISKTIPQTLMDEHLEINTLVTSITSLNQGNMTRGKLLDTLKGKFPDLFNNIDREKITNGELLNLLQKVNGEYEKRIKLAQFDLTAQTYNKEAQELIEFATKARMQSAVNSTGKRGFMNMPNSQYLSMWEQIKYMGSGTMTDADPASLLADAKRAEAKAAQLMQQGANTQFRGDLEKSLFKANDLIREEGKRRELWGKDFAKNNVDFLKEVDEWRRINKQEGGQFKGEFLTHDWSKLQQLVQSAAAGKEGTGAGGGEGMGGSEGLGSKGVTHSGPKSIVVNINREMIGSLAINSYNIKEGVGEMEGLIEEALHRILVSATASE